VCTFDSVYRTFADKKLTLKKTSKIDTKLIDIDQFDLKGSKTNS